MPCENEEFDDLANRLVGDRFSIEREIGAGAFGRVVEAHDLVLGRRVAIKVIPLRGARPKEAQALLHEARAAASAGPSAVAVYDVLSPSAGIAKKRPRPVGAAASVSALERCYLAQMLSMYVFVLTYTSICCIWLRSQEVVVRLNVAVNGPLELGWRDSPVFSHQVQPLPALIAILM